MGPPTTQSLVRGKGFGPEEQVVVEFDDVLLRSAATNETGRFATRIEVPDWAPPGSHVIAATGQSSGESAQAQFIVRTDWSKFHFDLANSAFNPFENVLNPANVAGLTTRWAAETSRWVGPDPIVVEGIVYAASYYGTVYGFDAVTGGVVWTAWTGSLMSSAAPAVEHGVLYIGDLDGEVAAFDTADGSTLWTATSDGTVTAPVAVSGGKVYVTGSQDESDWLYAFDGSTGALLWKTDQGEDIVNSPAVSDGVVYVAGINSSVYAFDADTGTLLWASPAFPPGWHVGGAVSVGEGLVFVTSSHDTVYARDASTGSIIWASPAGGSLWGTPIVGDGIVYVASGSPARLYAFEAATGELLWRAPAGVGSHSSLAVANGVLYQGDYFGTIQAFDATDGRSLWSSPYLGGSVWGAPVIADGVLYTSIYGGTVYAFSLP